MNQKQKLLELLRSGFWVNATELHKICWRYGARLWDLRSEGYVFEKRKGENGLEDWRLVGRPENKLF